MVPPSGLESLRTWLGEAFQGSPVTELAIVVLPCQARGFLINISTTQTGYMEKYVSSTAGGTMLW